MVLASPSEKEVVVVVGQQNLPKALFADLSGSRSAGC
jgi:hypothetical protein